MIQLLVNTPTGKQELIEVHESGGYFEPERIIWSTLPIAQGGDGPLPEGAVDSLGGLIKDGGTLVFNQSRKDEHEAVANKAHVRTIAEKSQAVRLRGDLDRLKQELAGQLASEDFGAAIRTLYEIVTLERSLDA